MEQLHQWQVVFITRGMPYPTVVCTVEAPTHRDALIDGLLEWRLVHGRPWVHLSENYRAIKVVRFDPIPDSELRIMVESTTVYTDGEAHFLTLVIEEIEEVWAKIPPLDYPPEFDLVHVPSDEEVRYGRGEDIFPMYTPEEVL